MVDPLRILLLEDVPSDAELMERELRKAGIIFTSERADDGESFIKALELFKPNLILADFKLPNFDALQALDLIREKIPKILFIIVTGAVSEEVAVECMKQGADDYLLKDRLARLGEAVMNALEKQSLRNKHAEAEATLRRMEENFHRSLDESPLGIRILTEDDETLYANRQFLYFYGYDDITELNKVPTYKRYTPKSYAEFKHRKETRNLGGFGPSEYGIEIVRKNGEIRYLQVFRKAILWNGVQQFQTISQDITERKQAEIELGIIKNKELEILDKELELIRTDLEDLIQNNRRNK